MNPSPFSSSRMRFRTLFGLAATTLFVGACEDDPAPLFTPTGSGSVSGIVFFDIDGNGQFNPLTGDTLAGAGVTVQIRDRGTTTVLGSTATNTSGEFTFTGLPVGTHDVYVPSQSATGAWLFCANPTAATIYLDESAFVRVPARNGCVVKINVAEAQAPGAVVTIRGAITAVPGTFSSSNFYLQDNTGGTMIFGFSNPAGLTLALGDTVEVTGTLTVFRTELELTSATLGVEKKPGTPATPRVVTAAEVDAINPGSQTSMAHPLMGSLITIRRATVGAFTSGGNNNATLTDATGSIVIRTDGNAATAIPKSTFVAGQCYDITGILGAFDGAEQLKPRTVSDIVNVPCS